MKTFTQHIFVLLFCTLPFALQAQKNDSKYLAGAVPEVDGKVIFTKEIKAPGMSQAQIYEYSKTWLDNRMKKNENDSRIVYTDPQKVLIIGAGREWIVFNANALNLNRTEITYQPIITCLPEKCILEIQKIVFSYREGHEIYEAEKWISDEMALNKSKTKLVPALAKWRKQTIDFVDDLVLDLTETLKALPAQAVNHITSNIVQNKMEKYKEADPNQLQTNIIQMGVGKLVIEIGDDPNKELIVARLGGYLGKTSNKPAIFSYLSPDQSYKQIEKTETYTVSYYPANDNDPTIVLECKKLPAQEAIEGQPRMYIGEILKAWVK